VIIESILIYIILVICEGDYFLKLIYIILVICEGDYFLKRRRWSTI